MFQLGYQFSVKKIIHLYTTAGCHLCEQAESMFQYIRENDIRIADTFSLYLVDIANDEKLVEKYGVRIPVLASSNLDETNRELG